MKETELYAPVKEWLENKGYTVYPEVEHRHKRADIVAVNESGHSIIVELKTSLSLELLAQGVDWVSKGSANQVYLAVPHPQKDASSYVINLVRREKLGLLFVNPYEVYLWVGKCNARIEPGELKVIPDQNISKALTPMHLELGLEGGHSGGGYLTEYRATMIRVKQYLSVDCKGEWTPMKDIISNCPTHYRGQNPGQSLANGLEKFEDWCETKIINRRKHFRVRRDKK
jgi:hypothetical protein